MFERNFKIINKKFRELLIPTIAVSIAGNFAVLIDAFLISLIMGSNYLTVIQSIEPFSLIVGLVYWMIGMGGAILCSYAKADFDDEKADTIFTISVVSVVIIGLIITLSAFIFNDYFTQILCQVPQMQPYVSQYLLLYSIGIPFMCYMACVAYFIKSYGFIKLQFWAFLLSNIINTFCDILFLKYLNLGIASAGLATSIGFIIAALFISSYFFNPKKSIKLVKVKTSQILNNFINICKSGTAVSSQNLYEALRLIFINYLVTITIGAVGLEAYNMCCNILFIVMIFIIGTLQSIVPIVSVYYKEEDYNGVAYVCDKSMQLVIGFGLIFSLLFFIYPDIALFAFNVKDPNSIPVVLNAVRLFSLSFIGFAVNNLYIFYTQTVERIKLSNIISIIQGLIFPIVFVYLCSIFWGINGIWIGFTVSELIIVLIIFVYSKIMSKKTNNELSGFFLINHNENKTLLEYTVEGNIENIADLSKIVQESLSSKQPEIAGLAIKEMLENIIKINDGVDLIDIMIKDKDNTIVLSVKYSGIVYNPLKDKNRDDLSVLSKYVENIEYSQILELNNIEITLHND